MTNMTTVPLPKIGLQLHAGLNLEYLNYKFQVYTSPQYVQTGYCLNCGTPFFKTCSNKEHKIKFCSRKCAAIYIQCCLKENRLRLAYKNTDSKELTEFFKKYSNYVYSEIYKYEHEYSEDLREWWSETAVRHCYNIKKWEKSHGRTVNKFAYLKRAVEYAFLQVRQKRSKEVFYDECNLRTQEIILGCNNYD